MSESIAKVVVSDEEAASVAESIVEQVTNQVAKHEGSRGGKMIIEVRVRRGRGRPRKIRPSNPNVCNLINPVRPEHALLLAQKLTNGEPLTVEEVNAERYTADEVRAQWGEYDEATDQYLPDTSMNAALYAGRPANKVPAVPAMHQPAVLAAANELNMLFASSGQASRSKHRPANWPDYLPDWQPGMTVDLNTGRRQVSRDVRRHVLSPEKHLVSIGSYEYVIGGTETASDVFHGSKGTSGYSYLIRALSRLSMRGVEGVDNLVFQIGNKCALVTWTGDGTQGAKVALRPNEYATAGNLIRAGEILTTAEIQEALASENTKGIRFQPLKTPIVGQPVSRAALINAVKRAMNLKSTADESGMTLWERAVAESGSEDNLADRFWYNISNVQIRQNPASLHCFGLRNGCVDQAFGIQYGESRSDKRLVYILGARCGDEYTVNSRTAMVDAQSPSVEDEPAAEIESDSAEVAEMVGVE